MAAPKSKDPKTKAVNVRMTDTEHAKLTEAAMHAGYIKPSGYGLGTYLRDAGLGLVPFPGETGENNG